MEQAAARELMKKLGFEFTEEVVGGAFFTVLVKGQEARLSALMKLIDGVIIDFLEEYAPTATFVDQDSRAEWMEEWLVG